MIDAVDAGLEELTAEVLGPADAPTGEQAPTEEAVPEPTEPPAAPEASAPPAPTPPVAPPATPPVGEPGTVEINGKRYTLEQLAAAIQTREQFPHLQEKYVALKRSEEARLAAEAAAKATTAPVTPQQTLAAMKASFEPVVKGLVEQGFIEEDLAALYPNAMLGFAMLQQSQLSSAQILNEIAQKVRMYEGEITHERTVAGLKNNMVALSSMHESLKPLADPTVQDQFLAYLYELDPKQSQLQDKRFWVQQWAAFRQDANLTPGEAPTPSATTVAAVKADERRRAQGAPLPGSRPAATKPAPASPLDEMFEDVMSGNVVRK